MRPDLYEIEARAYRISARAPATSRDVMTLLAYIGELEGARDTALVEQVNQLSARIERDTAALNDLRWKIGRVRAQHRPSNDDGVTYCGWDKRGGCGELWPCSTIRALDGQPAKEAP